MSKLKIIIFSTGVFLLMVWVSSVMAQKGGETIFRAKNCGGCHSISPPKIGTFEEKMKEKGPNLSYAGSKFSGEWLKRWLANPEEIRHTKYGTLIPKPDKHVALDAKEAEEVSEYLATLKDTKVVPGIVPAGELGGAARIKAKTLFEKKKACYACHKIKTPAGKTIGGLTGPDLTKAGERLSGDWVYSYLKDPIRYEPKGRSPVFELSDDDAKALSAYVMSFK